MKNKHLPVALALLTLTYALFYPTVSKLYRTRQHFSLSNISSSLTYEPQDCFTLQSPLQLEHTLDQAYRYAEQSSDSFNFVSKDGNYVLKLIKRPRKTPLIFFLPPPTSFKKKEHIWESYLITGSTLKEETGLLFLHLQRTDQLHKNLTVSDKYGKIYTIDLNDYAFLIQKNTHQIYPTIIRWMQEGKSDKAKALINNMLQVVRSTEEKSISYKKATMNKTFGCIDEQCLLIDVGQLQNHLPTKPYSEDIDDVTKRFNKWLQKHYPELSTHLENQLRERKNNTG